MQSLHEELFVHQNLIGGRIGVVIIKFFAFALHDHERVDVVLATFGSILEVEPIRVAATVSIPSEPNKSPNILKLLKCGLATRSQPP